MQYMIYSIPVGSMAGLSLLIESCGVVAGVELRILEKFHQVWIGHGLEPSLFLLCSRRHLGLDRSILICLRPFSIFFSQRDGDMDMERETAYRCSVAQSAGLELCFHMVTFVQ